MRAHHLLTTAVALVAAGTLAAAAPADAPPSQGAASPGVPSFDRSTRPDLPSRFTRPDNPALFDARVKQFREPELSQMKMRGRFTVAVGGDIISTFPIAQLDDPALQAVLGIIRGADIGLGNSETSIADYSKATCCLGGMMGPKETAADIKAMGFKMLNKASNHLSDTGTGLLQENLDILHEAGLVFSGTGRNLQEARAAAYLSTAKGRAAIVGSYGAIVDCHQCAPGSDNSGTDMFPAQWASYQLGFSYGSAGLNPLRMTRYKIIPQAEMDMLAKFDAANRVALGEKAVAKTGLAALKLDSTWYKVGPEADRGTYSYGLYPDDLAQIDRSVRNGKEQSDFLSVLIHAHETRGPGPQEPDFLIEYAHSVIDNGADLFARSGPWEVRGIEIYKGRPIFYGLGLMVGGHANTPVGYDRYRDHGLDAFATDFTDVELNWASWYGQNIIIETDRNNILGMEGAVAEAVFQDGKLTDVIITPTELAYNRPMSQMGIPRLATGKVAQKILTRLQGLSKPFGTNITIKGDKGYIRVGPDGRSM